MHDPYHGNPMANPHAAASRTEPLAKTYIKDIHERALDFGTLLVGTRIDEDSLYTVYHTLSQMIERRMRQAQPDPIKITINSPGGDAFLGLAIGKMIAESPVPIHTRVVGIAASAAAIIFLGGHKRTVAPGSRVMFHDSWVYTFSATAEHNRRQADLHEGLDREMVDFVCERTGLERSFVETECSKDHWYIDQSQAGDLGISNDGPKKVIRTELAVEPAAEAPAAHAAD